jgi:DnaJ-class molecular chaperone
MGSSKNYYHILGVEKNASAEDIKKAYRKMAHQHHPDKQGGNEAKFKEINEAYQVLSNPQKKAQYDQFGQTFDGGGGGNPFQGGNPFGGFEWDFQGGGGPDGFGDIFDIFNQFARAARARGSDVRVEHRISLEDAYRGLESKFKIRLHSGEKEISVKIPAGIEDGQAIKITGAGEMGERSAGDLYVIIRVIPHKYFERRGADLWTVKEIKLKDVLLGHKFSVAEIGGGNAEFEVPVGHNLREPIKISGKGMPKSGLIKNRGDLYVYLEVKVPKVSSKLKKSLEED